MGNAYLYGNGGSGAGLNFKIVGGTTQPAAATANLMWINTDVRITSYIFSATEPSNPSDGMVWIKTGDESDVAFSATKKNPVILYPVAVKQYVSGEWVGLDASMYINGAWVEFSLAFDGVLFDNGDQKTYITDGWYLVDDGAMITASNKGDNTISDLRHTNSMIDLTDWSVVNANLTHRTGTANLIITKDLNPAFANFTAYKRISSGFDITMDVSDLDGEYYVALAAGLGSASLTANKVWLE